MTIGDQKSKIFMEFPSTAQFFYVSSFGKVHYRRFEIEDAPVVVILPGFTMPSSLYVPLAQDLYENKFSVIIVDYWGRGHSEPRKDGNYSLCAHINLLINLLDHLHIKKCNFIGISYGAALVSGLVSQAPDYVDKIAFISPLHFTDESPTPLQKFTLGMSYLGPMLLRFAAPRQIPQQIRNQFAKPEENEKVIQQISELCLNQYQTNWAHANVISRAIGMFDAAEVEQSISCLASVNKKMLVMLGEKDQIIHIDECKAWWTRWIQNARIVVVEDVGHFMFIEKLYDTTSQLVSFLNK